jgi:hypothetical protein
MFETLRNHTRTTQFFLDMLDMIEKDLLRMTPSNRVNCDRIVKSFEEFQRKCDLTPDNDYCTNPIFRPKRAATNLSELERSGTTPVAEYEGPIYDAMATRPLSSDSHDSLQNPRWTSPELSSSSLRRNHRRVTQQGHQLRHAKSRDPDELLSGENSIDGTESTSPKKVQFDGTDLLIPAPTSASLPTNDSGLDMTFDNTENNGFEISKNCEPASKKQNDAPSELSKTSKYDTHVRPTRSALKGSKKSSRSWPLDKRLGHSFEPGDRQFIEPIHLRPVSNINGDKVTNVSDPHNVEVSTSKTTSRNSLNTNALPLKNDGGSLPTSEPMALNTQPRPAPELVLPQSIPEDDENESDPSQPLLERYSTSENRSCEEHGYSSHGNWFREAFCCR